MDCNFAGPETASLLLSLLTSFINDRTLVAETVWLTSEGIISLLSAYSSSQAVFSLEHKLFQKLGGRWEATCQRYITRRPYQTSQEAAWQSASSRQLNSPAALPAALLEGYCKAQGCNGAPSHCLLHPECTLHFKPGLRFNIFPCKFPCRLCNTVLPVLFVVNL